MYKIDFKAEAAVIVNRQPRSYIYTPFIWRVRRRQRIQMDAAEETSSGDVTDLLISSVPTVAVRQPVSGPISNNVNHRRNVKDALIRECQGGTRRRRRL